MGRSGTHHSGSISAGGNISSLFGHGERERGRQMLNWTKIKLQGHRAYIYTSGQYDVSQPLWSDTWRACYGNIPFDYLIASALEAMARCENHAMQAITNRLLGK